MPSDTADMRRAQDEALDLVEELAPAPAAAYAPEDFVTVRDVAVMIGQAAQALSIEQLEGAIAHADRAQGIGPILDPTAFIRGRDELDKQLRYFRALLAFRRAIEDLRPLTLREAQ